MKNISIEFVEEFNNKLRNMNSILKLYKTSGYSIDIKLIEDNFLNMESQIINPSEDFYKYLESFFEKNGHVLTYNNTRSCFWSAGTD